MKAREILRTQARNLAFEIQSEKNATPQCRRAADLLLLLATELEGPAWADTDVPMTIGILLGSVIKLDPPIEGVEFGVDNAADNNFGFRKLRELFNYLDPQ